MHSDCDIYFTELQLGHFRVLPFTEGNQLYALESLLTHGSAHKDAHGVQMAPSFS
jgi:hypothetical protein